MTVAEFNQFNNFLGFGNSINPDLVFFGLEEGAGKDDFSKNLNYRMDNLNNESFKDLRKFHNHIDAPKSMRRWYESTGNVQIQKTWTRYCALILALENNPINIEKRREYQENELGALGGKTLLIERYPLPRHSHSVWDDQLNVEGLFTNVKEYFNYCNTDGVRKQLLIDLLKAERFCPKAIVVHGANAVRGILDFFENDNGINIKLNPLPIEGLPLPQSWSYYEWKKKKGNVKIIFMPFIQGYPGLVINMDPHLISLADWISNS
jgi:hypothetical protein